MFASCASNSASTASRWSDYVDAKHRQKIHPALSSTRWRPISAAHLSGPWKSSPSSSIARRRSSAVRALCASLHAGRSGRPAFPRPAPRSDLPAVTSVQRCRGGMLYSVLPYPSLHVLRCLLACRRPANKLEKSGSALYRRPKKSKPKGPNEVLPEHIRRNIERLAVPKVERKRTGGKRPITVFVHGGTMIKSKCRYDETPSKTTAVVGFVNQAREILKLPRLGLVWRSSEPIVSKE